MVRVAVMSSTLSRQWSLCLLIVSGFSAVISKRLCIGLLPHCNGQTNAGCLTKRWCSGVNVAELKNVSEVRDPDPWEFSVQFRGSSVAGLGCCRLLKVPAWKHHINNIPGTFQFTCGLFDRYPEAMDPDPAGYKRKSLVIQTRFIVIRGRAIREMQPHYELYVSTVHTNIFSQFSETASSFISILSRT